MLFSRLARRSVAGLLAALLALTCTVSTAYAQHTTADSFLHNAADPFYQPPSAVPERPGELIRHHQAAHLLNVADPAALDLGLEPPQLPGRAWRMMYSSTDASGQPVAVTGVVMEPANPWTGPGPQPTVVMAAGTRGQGDACAPSKGPWLIGALDLEHEALDINYELSSMYAASLSGMRVIMTDYIGLGTPGMHHYVNQVEQAHAVIDSARAQDSSSSARHRIARSRSSATRRAAAPRPRQPKRSPAMPRSWPSPPPSPALRLRT